MPDKQDSQHQHDERDERDRRIEALRSLAGEPDQQTPQQTNGPPVIASQEATPARRQVSGLRGHKRVTLVAIAVLLVMAVAGGLVAHSVISPASKSTQPTLTSLIISPAESNFSCPRDIAWSPKSTSLALLGYQGYCAQSVPTIYSYHPGIIILDDITSGKQTNTLHPDDSIAAALGLKPPTVATPMSGVAPADRNTSRQVIDYGHLLWSPDGKQLAVTFTVSVATAEAGSTNFVTSVTDGVLLMSPSGGETRILSHRRARGEVYSGHWNLSTSTYIPLPVASPSPDDSNGNWYANVALIPPSLRYQWNSAGELLPVAPLNTTSAPVSQQAAPVGLADGGKEFTVWQPGVAQIITHNHAEPPRPLKAPVETWQTSFASWSADGSYVFAGNWGGQEVESWRLASNGQPSPDATTLALVGLASAPLLPIRDEGMAAALQRFHDTSLNPNAQYTPVNFAWRPDGSQVAVEGVIPESNGADPQVKDFAVRIYDCASGKLLKTLPLMLSFVTMNM